MKSFITSLALMRGIHVDLCINWHEVASCCIESIAINFSQ